ncbi:Cleavage and polyadenylation specificity factor,73 kDa subunit [Richelia intracellularis HH01]|uniref:Cleavage and polyadenylation specificity factor,73 kDa subunit n=1 Tax=Richelia intracellularis HH01 TaxID=1165094 RepID=M1WYU9_9NOST|nr:MBL fold metallo-hydrolase [Richelia intracellularis]CCH67067.1 Cleavage and polyadenylation specificity factor,73 kDa subunit [Richelia intracellularis HH01]
MGNAPKGPESKQKFSTNHKPQSSFDLLTVEANNELECFTYGVNHNGEGICLLVSMGPHRFLLDCGLIDISSLVKDMENFSQTTDFPLPVDGILVTHAHPDHSRGLLALHKEFPLIPIYASEVTSELLHLNWLDCEQSVPQFCQALPLRTAVELKEGLLVELYPAGHLPGAVIIMLTYITPKQTYSLMYTGDFFLSNSRLVEGLRLEELRGFPLDVLVVGATYGTLHHPHRRHQENQLVERINSAIKKGYSVILPTPPLGLGQELLMLLRSHHYFTGRDIDIWVDGAVAIGCDAYLKLLPHLPASVQNFARYQPLFWDERVRPRVRRLNPEEHSSMSQSLCIILTDSLEKLSGYYQSNDKPWLILIPEKTEVKLEEQSLKKVMVETYFLAQHSDASGTTQLIHNLRPQHIIFVHGSPNYLTDLACLEELQNRYHIHSPTANMLVELPIGEVLLQPNSFDTSYKGEITELGTMVTITLPDEIVTNPRWRQFADTGLVEARWQGEDLIVRGLSPKELISQTHNRYTSYDIDCCSICKYQRKQRCWNQASHLYNFKVTLDGYCPAFKHKNQED